MREPVIPELDTETYLLWESKQPERHELHHGFIVAFAGGTLDHNHIGRNLAAKFEVPFPLPCRTFGFDFKVRVGESTLYYSDVIVVCVDMPGTATVIDPPESSRRSFHRARVRTTSSKSARCIATFRRSTPT